MSILDTIFVRMSHRGKGYTKALINQLMTSPDSLLRSDMEKTVESAKDGQLIGFSSPISNGMLWLLIRMIVADEIIQKRNKINSRMPIKEKLWLIESMDATPRNIWWSAAKLASDRGLNKHSWCL